MVKIINLIFIVFILTSCGKKGDIIIKNNNDNLPASIDQERVYKF
jgi:predicted small lipoprotein YifL